MSIYSEWQKTLSHDNNYISHVTNFHNFTEHVIKLTQDVALYLHLKERQNFRTNVNCDNKVLQNTHTSF